MDALQASSSCRPMNLNRRCNRRDLEYVAAPATLAPFGSPPTYGMVAETSFEKALSFPPESTAVIA